MGHGVHSAQLNTYCQDLIHGVLSQFKRHMDRTIKIKMIWKGWASCGNCDKLGCRTYCNNFFFFFFFKLYIIVLVGNDDDDDDDDDNCLQPVAIKILFFSNLIF